MNVRTTLDKLNVIADNLSVGMSFDDAIAVVTDLAMPYGLNFAITPSDDDNYADILIGDTYGDNLYIDFDDDDKIDTINLGDADDLDW